ncbi:hypothetical protein ACGP04_03485 [Piscirickettsia salmonis]
MPRSKKSETWKAAIDFVKDKIIKEIKAIKQENVKPPFLCQV